MAIFFLTSALMVTAVLAIRFIFKNKLSFLILYPLWGLVLLRLLIPVNIIESPVSILNIADTLKNLNSKETITLPAPATAQADVPGTSFSNTKNQNIKKTGKNISINKNGKNNKIVTPEENKEPAVENSQKNIQKTNIGYKKEKPAQGNIIIKLAIVIWISGSIVFFMFVIISNTIFYKKLKTNRKHIHTSSKGIPVYISDTVNTPCLTGILHPAVYLPVDINSSTIHLNPGNIQDKHLKQVLAHEYTHIKHKDNIWSLMRIICLGIYWFHPFVWIAAFYSKQDAELACDEALLKNCTNDEKYDYGKMLLTMSQKDRQNKLCLATSLGSSKNNLKERITMITKKRNLKKYQIALMASFSVIIAGCGMTNSPAVPVNNNKTASNPVNTTNPEATTSPKTTITPEAVTAKPNPSEDKRIKAFEEFMKKDILSCPEWSKFKGSAEDLYFNIQYTADNIPCLFVTDHTFEISDTDSSSSHAYVYYYDTKSKKPELLIHMACSSSGESVSVADGIFMTDTHHSYTTYTFNSKDNTNTLVAETIEGYYIYDDETEKQSDNFTYTKHEFELPFNNKTRKNIAGTPYKDYAQNTSQTPHYSVPDALDFAGKWDEAVPIDYYKNTKNKWKQFYKDGYMPLSYTYTYGMYHGNLDKTICKSLGNIKPADFTKAEQESSIIINGTRISYCGKLSKNVSLYYLNTSNGGNAILTYEGFGRYNLEGITKSKNLKSSDTPPDIIAETGMPEFTNGDFDNDGEDETAFYIKDNLYIIDYSYDYSYKDYGITLSSIYEIYPFTKDDARYFTEQLCLLYDNNPEQLGTETLNKIKTKTNNKNCKSKINIISDNGYKDYDYILSGNSLENEYEFGNSNSYSITLEDGKPQIKASIGITYNTKGETRKHHIKLEAAIVLNENNKFVLKELNKFVLKEPFSFTKED